VYSCSLGGSKKDTTRVSRSNLFYQSKSRVAGEENKELRAK